MPESKWLVFRRVEAPERKTQRWTVLSRLSGLKLGEVAWYGPWRQYAFLSDERIVLAGSCFADLSAFIVDLMVERRTEHGTMEGVALDKRRGGVPAVGAPGEVKDAERRGA